LPRRAPARPSRHRRTGPGPVPYHHRHDGRPAAVPGHHGDGPGPRHRTPPPRPGQPDRGRRQGGRPAGPAAHARPDPRPPPPPPQALRSSRFHAVADQAAVLASEVPLAPAADRADLRAPAAAARDRLADAVAALPLVTAGSPYNAEALIHGLSPDPAPHPQD